MDSIWVISLAHVNTVIKAALAAILLITAFFTFFNAIINPEIIIFGRSLGGITAVTYLLIMAVIGIIITYLIFNKEQIGTSLCFLYFLYHILDILITNRALFQSYSFPILRVGGFLLTIILLIINKFGYYGNQ